MLIKFFRGSVLAQAFMADTRSGPERLAASPWATATTPDQLIVAHILQSVVTKNDEWRWRTQVLPKLSVTKNYKKHDDIPREFRYAEEFTLAGPGLAINFRTDTDGSRPGWYITVKATVIRDKQDPLVLETDAGNTLAERLSQFWSQLVEAQKAARQAELAMQANEKKWNLAEELLGMKRNEHGALVPIED